MKALLVSMGLACASALPGIALAQSTTSTGAMTAAKPVGVSASTAMDAQQKAASSAGSVGTVVRTSESAGTKAMNAKDSAMDHTRKAMPNSAASAPQTTK